MVTADLEKELEKFHPSGLDSFLYTIKQKVGSLKHLIRMCTTISEVFDHLANQHLRGIEGLEKNLISRTASKGSHWSGGLPWETLMNFCKNGKLFRD